MNEFIKVTHTSNDLYLIRKSDIMTVFKDSFDNSHGCDIVFYKSKREYGKSKYSLSVKESIEEIYAMLNDTGFRSKAQD